jgi:hypothetical protein
VTALVWANSPWASLAIGGIFLVFLIHDT